MTDDPHALPGALLDPACYPHPTGPIELVETHISWVLLTGGHAYKIKKPLRLPFLDFSTLDARRHFCEEELRVNRRLAPSVYLAVVPIAGSPAEPRIEGRGPPFEYAVKMLQFEAAGRLDRLAARGALDEAQVREAARLVARFHDEAGVAAEGSGFATPARLRREALDNFAALEGPAGRDPALARLREWTERSLDACAGLAARRLRSGRVRECHGDLHLANLTLWQGRVLAFDAIEFDERLRWIDVMAEVAFAAMDLHHHGQPALANAFVDEYLEHSGDYEGVAILGHYLVYRALVRAKIAAIRVTEGADARAEMASYLSLAAQFAFERHRPFVLITHGPSGAGKSYVARLLAAPARAVRLRSDVERARLVAEDASAHGVGEGRYSPAATERTYGHLETLAASLLGAGQSVIVDATFTDPRRRERFRTLAREHDASFRILSCRADPALLHRRVRERAAAGEDASQATPAVLEAQLASFAPLLDAEADAAIAVDTAAPLDVAAIVRSLHGDRES